MSSLAGALIPPGNAGPPAFLPVEISVASHVSSDVEMQAPDQELELTLRDEEPLEEQNEEMDDLFGNDEDVEREKPVGAQSPEPLGEGSDRLLSPEREHRKALEYEEDDEPGGVVQEVKEAIVPFPNIPVPKSSDGDNWVIRMPNFVKVDSKPYHPDTYMGPEHEDDESQQAETLREKSMTIKLKVENTVRWRWIKDEFGQDYRQSNSRVVRWSDGSLSLRLGKELFDINQSIDTSGGMPRQPIVPNASQSLSQSQAQTADLPQSQFQTSTKSQGLTYLVAQHKRAQVLQSEALVTGYMTLRPTGMQSETHRMLVRAVGQKHNKVARLRMAPDPDKDPEREKLELMKQSAKKSKKKADMDDGLGGGRRRRSYSRKRAGHDVWSDDDGQEGHEFAASEEEGDEDGIGSGRGSPRKEKRKAAVDDEKKGAGEYQEDDFVVADSSDEDAGSDGGGNKKRKRRDDVMEDDPLDKLDAQINKQEDEQKRRRQSGAKAEDDGVEADTEEGKENEEEEMDVESEEEEEEEGEEFKIRRAGTAGGTGVRKKRAIDFDDGEEE